MGRRGVRMRLVSFVCALVSFVLAALVFAGCEKPTKPTLRLEVVRVDDTLDPFRNEELLVPRGVTLQTETLPPSHRVKTPRTVRYATLAPDPGETPEAARARIEPWVRSLSLPLGTRLAWLRTPAQPTAARSLVVVAGDPIVTTEDVANATTVTNDPAVAPYVNVTLRRAGRTRFVAAMHELVGRRIAIVVDDRVMSVAVVSPTMRGGHVKIEMTRTGREAQMAEAKEIARGLGGR